MSSASLLFTDSSLSSRFPRVLSSPDLVPTVSLPHALSLIDSLLHAPPCASRSFLPLANGMHLFGFALPLVTTLSSSSSSSSSSSRCCLSADVEGKSSSDEDASVRALSLWIVDSVLPHAREIAREYDEMHHHDSSSISKSFPSSVYAFVIHYAVEDGDRSLGPHMDDAQVTVNICLRRGEDTQGADVCFYGEDVLIGNAEVDPESGPQVTAPSIPTYALVHGPDAIHRVTSLVSGFRTNLVFIQRRRRMDRNGFLCFRPSSSYVHHDRVLVLDFLASIVRGWFRDVWGFSSDCITLKERIRTQLPSIQKYVAEDLF